MLTRIAPSFAVAVLDERPLGAVGRPDAHPVALAARRARPGRARRRRPRRRTPGSSSGGPWRTRPAPRGRPPAPPSGPGSPRSCRPAGARSRSRCCRTAARGRSRQYPSGHLHAGPVGPVGRVRVAERAQRQREARGPRRTGESGPASSLVSSVSGGPPSSELSPGGLHQVHVLRPCAWPCLLRSIGAHPGARRRHLLPAPYPLASTCPLCVRSASSLLADGRPRRRPGDVAWTGCPPTRPPRSPPGCAPAATSSWAHCWRPAPTSPAPRPPTSSPSPAGWRCPSRSTGPSTSWTPRPCRCSTSCCSRPPTGSPPTS